MHHTMKTYWGGGGGCIGPRILDLGTRRRWVVSFTPRRLYPRHPLERRLGGPQSRSERGGDEKNSPHTPAIELPNHDRPARKPVAILTELPRLLIKMVRQLQQLLKLVMNYDTNFIGTLKYTGYIQRRMQIVNACATELPYMHGSWLQNYWRNFNNFQQNLTNQHSGTCLLLPRYFVRLPPGALSIMITLRTSRSFQRLSGRY
jgi:hypothetical protein